MDLSGFVITFRETLEAALVVGIVLAFLFRTKQQQFGKFVYAGVAAAVAASILVAFLFIFVAGEFTGRSEQLFEGATMLVAASLLTWMIVWMFKQRRLIKKQVEEKVSAAIKKQEKIEFFLLAFFAVFREGVETVIFLGAANFASGKSTITSGIFGISAAIFVSFIFFTAAKKVNLRLFFNVTSVLLVLFAAGLIAHSVHEFEEAGVLPKTIDHVWDISKILPESSIAGELSKSLFGYNSNPSLLEIIAYATYLFWMILIFKKMNAKQTL